MVHHQSLQSQRNCHTQSTRKNKIQQTLFIKHNSLQAHIFALHKLYPSLLGTYHSVLGKRPLTSKSPGICFGYMNGERPLPESAQAKSLQPCMKVLSKTISARQRGLVSRDECRHMPAKV